MDFEIFTYGGGEFLRITFNAVAALFGNGDYITALKVAATMGLLAVLVQAAFKGSAMNVQWILGFIMAYYVAILPRSNVIITDRIDPSQSAVVSNVPIGLAATAGLSSLFGDWLTRGFELLFALPDQMGYSGNGLLFGSKLVEASTRFELTDVRTQENLSEFWQQCVFYDILLGRYTWEDLYWHSGYDSMWLFVQDRTSTVRAFPYLPESGARGTAICKEALDATSGPLALDVQNAVTKAQRFYGPQLVRAESVDAAVVKFAASMPVSYQFLTGLSMSSEQIVRENALANSMKRGVSAWAAKVDAPAAAQDFALARAEAERRTSYGALGELAARMLPLIRNIMEAFIYAVFPIIGLLLMLPVAHKVAASYLKMILWVQLWAPLYAVLHGAITVYSRWPAEASLHYITPTGTTETILSLANYTGLAQVMADHAILAGYLTLSIPMIAYMLVSFSGSVAASIGGRILQSYESPVSQGASEATSGNLSLGNTSFGNAGWWAQNTAPRTTTGPVEMQGADGIRRSVTPSGEYVSFPESKLSVNVGIDQAMRESLSAQQAESVKSARNDVAAFTTATSAAYQNLTAVAEQITNNQSFAQQFDSGLSANATRQTDDVQKLTRQFAQENDLREEQAAQILGAATLSVTQPGLLKLVNPVDLSAQGSIRGTSQATDSELFKRAQQFAQETGYSERFSDAQEASSRLTASFRGDAAQSGLDQVQASFQSSEDLRRTAQASVERAETFTSARERLESSEVSFSTDLNNPFRQYLAEVVGGGDLRAADRVLQRAQMGSEADRETVLRAAGDFAREAATQIAGIGNPPTAGNLEARGGVELDALERDSRRSVVGRDQENRRDVQTAREISVTQGKDEVLDRVTGTAASAEVQRQDLERQAKQGDGAASAQSQPLRDTVETKTDSANQGLLGTALDGAGKVVPFVDKFSDIPDKLFGDERRK
ncbi:MAG: conjugal transfer protein TraG N-terminal domain-containing protein [Panacagrimonas sp.]